MNLEKMNVMNQQIDYIISELNSLKDSIEKKNNSDNATGQSNEEHSPERSNATEQNEIEGNESTVRPIRRRINRSFPLNRSKLLNESNGIKYFNLHLNTRKKQ